jgi:hypothetical protein
LNWSICIIPARAAFSSIIYWNASLKRLKIQDKGIAYSF